MNIKEIKELRKIAEERHKKAYDEADRIFLDTLRDVKIVKNLIEHPVVDNMV